MEVNRQQFQITSSMGNLLDHPELICEMKDSNKFIDCCHETIKENRITLDLADDIGYFNIKENEEYQLADIHFEQVLKQVSNDIEL